MFCKWASPLEPLAESLAAVLFTKSLVRKIGGSACTTLRGAETKSRPLAYFSKSFHRSRFARPHTCARVGDSEIRAFSDPRNTSDFPCIVQRIGRTLFSMRGLPVAPPYPVPPPLKQPMTHSGARAVRGGKAFGPSMSPSSTSTYGSRQLSRIAGIVVRSPVARDGRPARKRALAYWHGGQRGGAV